MTIRDAETNDIKRQQKQTDKGVLTDITIREAKTDDYQALYWLNKDSLGYDYPIEKTKQRLEHILQCPHTKIFVACIENNPVGYIHAEHYECTFHDCLKNILGFAVDQKHQHKGIGTALITAVEQWARETNAVGVRLVSGIDRIAAHSFYQARGYICRKEQKNFIKIF